MYDQQIGAFDSLRYWLTLVYQCIPFHLSFFVTSERSYCSQHIYVFSIQYVFEFFLLFSMIAINEALTLMLLWRIGLWGSCSSWIIRFYLIIFNVQHVLPVLICMFASADVIMHLRYVKLLVRELLHNLWKILYYFAIFWKIQRRTLKCKMLEHKLCQSWYTICGTFIRQI